MTKRTAGWPITRKFFGYHGLEVTQTVDVLSRLPARIAACRTCRTQDGRIQGRPPQAADLPQRTHQRSTTRTPSVRLPARTLARCILGPADIRRTPRTVHRPPSRPSRPTGRDASTGTKICRTRVSREDAPAREVSAQVRLMCPCGDTLNINPISSLRHASERHPSTEAPSASR